MTKHLNIHKPLPFSLSRIWFIMMFMVLLIGEGWSQNITKVEYFFDTDPGYDAGTAVPVNPPTPDISNLNINVSLAGLDDGIHRLFIRAKDENAVWGLSIIHTFYKDAIVAPMYDLVKVEYFIDTDPGFGNGTDVPFTPGPNISNLDFSIDINGLTNGLHQLYVRTKNQNGQWSLNTRRIFFKQDFAATNSLITYAEYYFDTDPGYGLATSILVNPNASDVTLDFSIDLTSLPDGFHQLCVRTKDTDGLWSQVTQKSFVKQAIVPGDQQITRIEYYFDTDPGLGNGTSIPFSPSTDVTVMDHAIDISTLSDGLHKLFIRAQDEGGVWSITNNWNFYKKQLTSSLQNIVAAEYFLNTDPGFDLGTAITVPGNSSQVDVSFVADLSSLNEGSNKMFVRTKDALGRWSQTTIHQFFKKSFSPALPDIVYAEYYIDSDPGMGQGINIPVPNPGPDVTDLTFQVDESLLVMGNHILFLRTKDENNHWSLTLLDEFCHSPQADFSANNVWLGDQTTFTDLSTSTDVDTEYYWDVDGDDITDYTNNTGFTHLYSSAGTYNARLILISAEGCPDTLIKQVSVFTCSSPTALAVSDTTSSSAMLHWTAANIETEWDIEYGLSGFTLGTGTTINGILTNPYNLTGLGQNTAYDFYIRSVCPGSTYSSWSVVETFITLDGAACSNPSDGGTIASAQTICPGIIPDPFTSVSAASGHSGILEYKWQLSTDNLVFTNIASSNSETLNYSNALYTTTWFKRLARVNCLTNWVGAGESNTIEITIDLKDEYRTKKSGDWNDITVWEKFDGTQWVDAVDYPSTTYTTCTSPKATIQNGDTVNLNTNEEFGNVGIDAGGILKIQDGKELGIVSGDTLSVDGELIMKETAEVNGAGNFRLKPGSTLHVGSPLGITKTLAEGNIKVTGTRAYLSEANYVYIGTADQVTGDGLMQNKPAKLTIDAPGQTVTATVEIDISSDVHIISGTFDVNNLDITLSGNWTNDAIFIPGTATVYFNNSVHVNVSVSNFYNIVFNGSDTVTALGNLTIYGEITINNYFNGGSFSHFVYGNWTSSAGAYVYGTSTIQFMGSGNIFISISNFYNIIFAGTGNVTALGSLNIYGNVTINNHFDPGNFTHYVYGNWVNNGTFVYGTSTIHFLGTGIISIGVSNFYNVIFGGSGTITATGALTFYGNVTINNYFAAGSYGHYVYGNWTNNGTFVYGTSTINFTGSGNIIVSSSPFYHVIFGGTGTVTAGGSLAIYGDVTINNYFNAGSYTHTVVGNWVNIGTFDYGTSTIEFTGTVNVSISVNNFYSVAFTGTGIFTANGSINFYGDVTINNGSTFEAGSYTHYIYGNWINNGTFVYGTSTIHFAGSTNITIGISNFYNVIFGGSGTVTAIGSITFFGDVVINNYFDAGTYVHYIHGGWINNGTFVHGTSTITFIGIGNINLDVNNFYNIVFAGSGNYTAIGQLTIYGDVTINNYFDAGSFTHFIYGNWTNNGTFVYGTSTIHFMGVGNIFINVTNFYNVIFGGSGTVTAIGSITFYNDVTINNYFDAGSYVHYIYGIWLNNGTFVHGTSTISFIGNGNINIDVNNFYNLVIGGTGIFTAIGSLTIYGDITINNYFDAGSYIHEIYGNWYNNGTFVYGTSTIYFKGTGNISLSANEFYHVIFGGSGTIVAIGTITFHGDVTIENHFGGGSYTHYVYGGWINTGTFAYGTSTIHFIGIGNVNIGISDFYHIVFAGTGTVTATGSLSVYGDFTINNYFDAGSFVHYIYGNWYNNGTFVYGTSTIHFSGIGNISLSTDEFYHVIFGGSGTVTAIGPLTFHGDVTINNYFDAGISTHYVYGGWINTGTFVYGTSTIHFLGTGNVFIGASDFYHIIFAGTGTITANGSLYIYGDITINNHFDAGSYHHYIYGNWYKSGTFVHATSTIHFVGAGNISLGINNFYHVVFAGTGNITATGSITIYGDITISNYFDAGSYTHYIHGNWINNGTFVYGTSTIIFSGSAQQTIGGSVVTEFYGYTVNNSFGILLNRNLIVRYMLTLTDGIITTGSYYIKVLAIGNVTGGSATAYIYGKFICGYNAIGSRIFPVGTANQYGPLELDYLTLTGTSDVEVEFFQGTITGTISGSITTVADHYWVISQSGGSSFTFKLRLDIYGFTPVGSIKMLRGDGLTVDHYTTTSPNYTNVTAFDTFGDFTLGEIHCAQPTALINRYVTLTTAILDWSQGDSELEWNVEYGPAGFSLGTGTQLTEVSTRPLELTGLTGETYYEFYVQSICSEEIQSSWVGPEPFSTFPKQLDATIFLEGPYDEDADKMDNTLATSGYVPLEQPYSGSPWNYSGTEQVASIPTGVVDWVMIEWRHASSPANADLSTYVWRKAAFLKDDGSIVDMDGSSLPWIGNPQLTSSLYIIVRHRNHLDVIGNFGASLASDIYSYDFSDQLNKVYGSSNGHKQIDSSPVHYGMASGDGIADGHINLIDKTFSWGTDAGKTGYHNGDFDMNGQTDNIDKNDSWFINNGFNGYVQD